MLTTRMKKKIKADRPRVVSEHEANLPGRDEERMRKVSQKARGSRKFQAMRRRAQRVLP